MNRTAVVCVRVVSDQMQVLSQPISRAQHVDCGLLWQTHRDARSRCATTDAPHGRRRGTLLL